MTNRERWLLYGLLMTVTLVVARMFTGAVWPPQPLPAAPQSTVTSSPVVNPSPPDLTSRAKPAEAAAVANAAVDDGEIDAQQFGVIGDYQYPALGTDNSARLQSCFDAASQRAHRAGGRVLVRISPGAYLIKSFLKLPYNVDLDMQGAVLHYRGTDQADAILTIGDDTHSCNYGAFRGLSITGHYGIPSFDESAKETFACIKVKSMLSSDLHVQALSGAAIGLLLAPARGQAVAHNRFHGISASVVKTGLELRGTYNTGWCNENDFYGCNFSLTSSAHSLGALTGVKFSVDQTKVSFEHATDVFYSPKHLLINGDMVGVYSDAALDDVPAGFDTTSNYFVVNATADAFQLSKTLGGTALDGKTSSTGNLYVVGYSGQNNNRFYGVCFQVNDHNVNYELKAGNQVATGARYVNMANHREYYCAHGGDVASVPTHPAGSRTDKNGVKFEYVGHYLRCPVWLDRAGSSNIFYGARWESGYGAFCRISHRPSLGIGSANNEFQVYTLDGNPRSKPVLDYFTDAMANCLFDENKIRLFGQSDPTTTTLANVHKRAIGSSGTLCVKGMCFKAVDSDVITRFATAPFVLCRDALYCETGKMLGVLVELKEYQACSFAFDNAGVDQGRLWVSFFDKNFKQKAINGVNDLSVGIVGGGVDSFYDAWDMWHSYSDTAHAGAARRNPLADVRYVFVGFSYSGIELSNVYVRPILGGGEGNYGNSTLQLRTPFEADSNVGLRFAYGTPTVGYFETTGEYISNIHTEKKQPLGWIVKKPGILAPPWTANTLVRQGELRQSRTGIFAARTAGNTGPQGMEPVSSASTSRSGITWDYVGEQAMLLATDQTY